MGQTMDRLNPPIRARSKSAARNYSTLAPILLGGLLALGCGFMSVKCWGQRRGGP